jgi:protein-disulfide isomerase
MKKEVLKVILGVFLLAVFIFPMNAKAATKVTNFKETIDEEIKTFEGVSGYEDSINTLKAADLSNYKESDNKVNVYVFRGSTCSYCLKAVAYFSSIAKEYGKYFNLVTYEVWNNTDNAALMNKVASVLGDTVGGVPYIVIGDKSFAGYSDTMNSSIEAKIKEEYNSKTKYDVMDKLDSSSTDKKSSIDLGLVAIILEIIIGIGTVIYTNVKCSATKKEIDEKVKKSASESKNNNKKEVESKKSSKPKK